MKKFLKSCFKLGFKLSALGALFAIAGLVYLDMNLPAAEEIEDVQLQTPLRIYSEDGLLIAEYGEKRRKPINLQQVPQTLVQAILATEDRRFYQHSGVDFRGLARAVVHLVLTGTKEQGGSTITMQVARNFFLSRKKSYLRKINEILLSFRIEKELTKDQILTLYLNKIYFGKRAYGVAAAAEVYYGVTIDKLNVAQMAMLAGLPQAPSAINPLNNPTAAIKRRNHVLNRMFHYGFISVEEYYSALEAPISAKYHERSVELEAPYVAEMVRQELIKHYGDDLYTAGYQVYTTLNGQQQQAANKALRETLYEYDQRHGFKGALQHLNAEQIQDKETWLAVLRNTAQPADLQAALVLSIKNASAEAALENGQTIDINWQSMQWAQRRINDTYLAAKPNNVGDVLSVGDVVYVRCDAQQRCALSQLPEASGALVALSPQNGAIKALTGGFDYNLSKFNRATQALRQPGSAFKPFIYSTALEHGFTAASIVNDAPVMLDEMSDDFWRPQNDNRKFYGPTRLREGLIRSRNLVSIRLLQSMGVDPTINHLARFGFEKERLPHDLSLALGTNVLSPLELATGYSVFANGGYQISPHFISRVQDVDGNIVEQTHPKIACTNCAYDLPFAQALTSNIAPLAIDPSNAYIISNLLRDAIQRGTGRGAKVLNRKDIAGKTGTTNDKFDAWFSGFHPQLVVTSWMGFDEPRSLNEYGSQAALPMWIKFMQTALKNLPVIEPELPNGIEMVKIDPETGFLAYPGQSNAIYEVFRSDHIPEKMAARPNQPYYPSSGGQQRDGGYNESLF